MVNFITLHIFINTKTYFVLEISQAAAIIALTTLSHGTKSAIQLPSACRVLRRPKPAPATTPVGP